MDDLFFKTIETCSKDWKVPNFFFVVVVVVVVVIIFTLLREQKVPWKNREVLKRLRNHESSNAQDSIVHLYTLVQWSTEDISLFISFLFYLFHNLHIDPIKVLLFWDSFNPKISMEVTLYFIKIHYASDLYSWVALSRD